jgi:hypothetical protein
MTNRLFGDWDKFRHILVKLSQNHNQYDYVIKSMGEKIAERIYELVEDQSIHLEALTKEYLSRKTKEGYDERTLIRKGDFLLSIKVIDIQSNGDELTVFIGVEDGMTTTKISMRTLAEFLEYGTEKMVGRHPILRSWEEMKRDVSNEVASRLKAEIRSDLR